jgi:cytochrome P450
MKLEAQAYVYPSPEVAACPFPHYAAMREFARVYKVPGRDEYVVTHHADIQEVLKQPEIFSNRSFVIDHGRMRTASLADAADTERVATFQSSDPPSHTVKRRMAFENFKPGKLQRHEATVHALADDLIDTFAADGRVEFVSQFSSLLSARASLAFVGLPVEDSDWAVKWSTYDGQGTRYLPNDQQDQIAAMLTEAYDYIGEHVRQRFESPRDDVLSEFVAAHVAEFGPEKGQANAVADTFSLMLGGVGTTSTMMTTTMYHLLSHPDQLEEVREDQALLMPAIEESLRLFAPVQWNGRLVTQDTEIAGVPIPAGALVLVAFAAANREPERWGDDAEEFNFRRAHVRGHLSFSYGIHTCIGAPFARMVGKVAMERLLTRFVSLSLAADNTFETVDSLAFYALKDLWIEFDPATAGR